MKIKLLLFAHLKELVQTSQLELEVTGSTVAQVLSEIKAQLPELADSIESGRVQVAVNEEYARPDQHLHDHDTLALIPPVSGG